MNQSSIEQPDVFLILRQIISEETNHKLEEISPDSHLEEDLSIEVGSEASNLFYKIIKKINQHYEIELDPQVFLEEDYENQTINLLVELVTDEINLQ